MTVFTRACWPGWRRPRPWHLSHFTTGFLFQARALLLGPTMSEQGRSQAAWTQGPLGAGIMLYLSLIEPMGTPRTLNRAQASSDVLTSLTIGQRERNWKTKRPWILTYAVWCVTSLTRMPSLWKHQCFFCSMLDRQHPGQGLVVPRETFV